MMGKKTEPIIYNQRRYGRFSGCFFNLAWQQQVIIGFTIVEDTIARKFLTITNGS